MSQPVAEVIASNTRQFDAEVYADAGAPDFGSWVEVPLEHGVVLYGLVSHVEHGSVEAGRQAVALGMSRDELRREMPQVLALTRTTLRAQVLAYRASTHGDGVGRLHQTLPPQPAALHDRVFAAGYEAVCALGAPFDFLRTLVRNPDPAVPVDDLVVAALRQTYRAHGQGEEAHVALLAAGRALSRLLNDDHERLESILRRAT